MKKDFDILLDCPVCGHKYDNRAVKIVSGKNNALLVHINCGNCKSNSLALISKNNSGATAVSMGMLTDLDYEEAGWMLDQTPITADEVLDLQEELKLLK